MCVNNLPKVATQWNSGTTRDSNRGRRVLIPSALTTRPPSHTKLCCLIRYVWHFQKMYTLSKDTRERIHSFSDVSFLKNARNYPHKQLTDANYRVRAEYFCRKLL